MKVWYKSKIDNYTLKNWIIFWDKINNKKVIYFQSLSIYSRVEYSQLLRIMLKILNLSAKQFLPSLIIRHFLDKLFNPWYLR